MRYEIGGTVGRVHTGQRGFTMSRLLLAVSKDALRCIVVESDQIFTGRSERLNG